MKQKPKLFKVAKIATGVAFLFFCLLNMKTVIKNNGKIEKCDSNEVYAIPVGCEDVPKENYGDCTLTTKGFKCLYSWVWHDCIMPQL